LASGWQKTGVTQRAKEGRVQRTARGALRSMLLRVQSAGCRPRPIARAPALLSGVRPLAAHAVQVVKNCPYFYGQ